MTYRFRIQGHLDDRWSAWLGAESFVRHDDGSTSFVVEITDQAHLHGVLGRVRDLGVVLLGLTTS